MSLNDPQKLDDAVKIRADWSRASHRPRWDEVKRAALLAWEGYLTSVQFMSIENMSITGIPRDQLEKLASIVNRGVWINNMTHPDQLGSILGGVKCPWLSLWNMVLNETSTRALVTAMDWVKYVWLWEVTLDIEELTQYDGQGRCTALRVWRDKRYRHQRRLKGWAEDAGWTVTVDSDALLTCICINLPD